MAVKVLDKRKAIIGAILAGTAITLAVATVNQGEENITLRSGMATFEDGRKEIAVSREELDALRDEAIEMVRGREVGGLNLIEKQRAMGTVNAYTNEVCTGPYDLSGYDEPTRERKWIAWLEDVRDNGCR